jgi:hypothetical protein
VHASQNKYSSSRAGKKEVRYEAGTLKTRTVRGEGDLDRDVNLESLKAGISQAQPTDRLDREPAS